MSTSILYGRELPPVELFSNATFPELIRLTRDRFTDYYTFMSAKPAGVSLSELGPSVQLLFQHNPHFQFEIGVAVGGAIVLTLFRTLLCNLLIGILVKHQLLTSRSSTRFSESLYSLIFYGSAFTLASIIESQNHFLSNPDRLWTGFSLSDQVPSLVWFLYMFEAAHYLHCLYAVLYINAWSKDSGVLFFHHIIALLLISISYLTRTHRIGILVLYLHDICDVIMESCKCIIKLQFTNKWVVRLTEALRVGCFLAFVVCWFVFRLYYFPLKVIYSAVLYLGSNPVHTWFPLSFLLYFLLWFIFTMNIYWATLIVKVLINAILGGHEEIDDIREQDEEPVKKGKSD